VAENVQFLGRLLRKVEMQILIERGIFMDDYKKFIYDISMAYAKVKFENAIQKGCAPEYDYDYLLDTFRDACLYYFSCGVPEWLRNLVFDDDEDDDESWEV